MDTTKPDPTFADIENARRRWLSAGRSVSRRAIDIHTINPDNPFDEPCWRVDGIEQLVSTNEFIAQAPLAPAAPTQTPAPGPRPQAFNLRPPVSNLQSPVSSLPLPILRTNGGAQARAAMDPAAVGDYADALRAGAKFPPAVAYYDGQSYWLADGFHRLEAHRAAGLEEMPCVVRQGTLRDAILFSVGANTTHGLRRTNADKRRSVERLLLDEEWRQWSDAEIARRTSVDPKTVASLRAQTIVTLEIPESNERLTADGRRMNVTNIGARPTPPTLSTPSTPSTPAPSTSSTSSTSSTPPTPPHSPAFPPERLPQLTAHHIAGQLSLRAEGEKNLAARQDRATRIATEIIEPAAHALADALLSGDQGAWAIVYRVVHGESAPPDLTAADLVAKLAAHWLRAGLNISLHDAGDPDVMRAEITRTMMRQSVSPPWITTNEKRAFAFAEKSS